MWCCGNSIEMKLALEWNSTVVLVTCYTHVTWESNTVIHAWHCVNHSILYSIFMALFCIYRYSVISRKICGQGNDCSNTAQFEEEALILLLQEYNVNDFQCRKKTVQTSDIFLVKLIVGSQKRPEGQDIKGLLWPGIRLDHQLAWYQSTSMSIQKPQIRVCCDHTVV